MPLGLPSREYFLKESSEKERKAYLKLMVEVAILFGAEREIAEIDMADVLDLETKIANVSDVKIIIIMNIVHQSSS